jgi:ABC-type sugar transport system ATPase subunit
MSTLDLNNLRKVFPDGTVAVDNVDISIADGEFLAIVGPSGCGKTTVLRMVAGLEAPTGGEIRIDDEVVNDQTSQQRDVAMAFQQSALYPHMTVAENLGFPLRMAGLHHIEVRARVEDMAGVLDLRDVLEMTPRRLSGGQQQRVSMGRAIIRNPRLFLMDEPMSNLDAKLRTAARVEITKIQRQLQATTLYVTHDQVEAMSMADRVVVMRGGRVAQMGAPLDVYRKPVDVFVAQFMGSPPMSIVPGEIELSDVEVDAGARYVLVIGPFRVPLPEAGQLDAWVGRELAIGVRPEALHRCVDGPIMASVDFTEHLGSEQLVHATIDCPGIDVVANEAVSESSARSAILLYTGAQEIVSLWEPLRLNLDVGETHVFDVVTGRRLGDLRAGPDEVSSGF